MSGCLSDYFRCSQTYLDYLQRHNPVATAMVRPMHWVKAWLDNASNNSPAEEQPSPASESALLAARVRQLEERLEQLENEDRGTPDR
jgi:hypothetical protein